MSKSDEQTHRLRPEGLKRSPEAQHRRPKGVAPTWADTQVCPHMAEQEGLTEEQRNRGMRLLLMEAALAGCAIAIFGIRSSPFLVGFAFALGASEFHIGILASSMTFGSSGQLLSNYLLEKKGSRKYVCLRALGASRLLRGVIILLPWLSIGLIGQHQIWFYIALLAVAGSLGSIGSVSRMSWLSDLIPEGIRGRYFSKRIRAMAVATVIGFLGGWFIDAWKTGHPTNEIGGFQLLLTVGVIFGLASLLVIRATPEPAMRMSREKLGFFETLKLPFKSGNFRQFMIFDLSWNFATRFAAPFFVVYMIKYLGVKYLWITVFTAMGQVASFYCAGFWGRIADKFGNKPVLMICGIAKAIFPFLWILVTPGSYILLGLVHLVRAFNSGQQLTTFNIVLKLSPRENKAMYISSYRMLSSLFGAVSPAIGGALAVMLSAKQIQLPFLTFQGLHFLFLLSCVLRFASLPLLRMIDEPDVKSVSYVVRVLRQIDGFRPTSSPANFAYFWLAPVVEAFKTVLKAGKALKETIGSVIRRKLGGLNRNDDEG